MRLIDADELFKEEREEYRNNAEYISTDYKHIFAEIDNQPTVCDLEQIRAEIEKKRLDAGEEATLEAYKQYKVRYEAFGEVLEIIDKYK